ncbi:retron system putative HNH endonuclease [Neolewinella agarilytica]|uniref:TIGR02646 family protein n=1 Tax=Neolewinella agarilytica TaxID=478744 RepID=A0A1H9HDJ0_9BACT|nr:retron system putative HNH endonuclease [Neolewinella agarilytica]SEQ60435.1 TIGR02646 family protein [Neolewinella agarilytica]
MRKINKGKEPHELKRHRTTPGADFESLDKRTIRAALVAEQGGICCYCMGPIQAQHDKMKIEHFACQKDNPELALVYSNMLGACRGNDQPGVTPADHHCDTRKADGVLSFNPANPQPDVGTLIEYGTDGTISSPNAQFDTELNEVLNLNWINLVNARKSRLSAFRALPRKKGTVPKATWEKHLRKFEGRGRSGNFQPHCEVVIFYLRKKLR